MQCNEICETNLCRYEIWRTRSRQPHDDKNQVNYLKTLRTLSLSRGELEQIAQNWCNNLQIDSLAPSAHRHSQIAGPITSAAKRTESTIIIIINNLLTAKAKIIQWVVIISNYLPK